MSDNLNETANDFVLETEKRNVSVNPEITELLKRTIARLIRNGQQDLAKYLNEVYKSATKNYFTVSVVGEFSRGKSSFINSFLKREFLPVGDLPTTAMLTRIGYGEEEALNLLDKKGKKIKSLSISEESWDNLTADSFSDDFQEMSAEVTIHDLWLADNNVELIDTPGAGDLSEKRAKIIGDALLSSDGAIITVSATQALSMSEKLFIEQRLIARKTPFMMMIITKLDQVKKEERNAVIDFILQRLALWKMEIPVYIPCNVEMPDDKYQNIMGMSLVREKISEWVTSPERTERTENWLIARTLSVMNVYLSSLQEQLAILSADDEKQKELIAEKKKKLSEAELQWGDLRNEMLHRCHKCYDMLSSQSEEYQKTVIQNLQQKLEQSNEPQKWWNDEYSYQLRVELTNLSVVIENTVSSRISEDADWFNASLEKSFQTNVVYKKETICDDSVFENSEPSISLELEDLAKQKSMTTIGAVLFTVVGFAICSSIGFFPIITTLGIGTGAGLLSQKLMSSKLEQQKKEVQNAIAQSVPSVIENALYQSEDRLRQVYDEIVAEAEKKEKVWLEKQKQITEESFANEDKSKALSEFRENVKYFESLKKELETLKK